MNDTAQVPIFDFMVIRPPPEIDTVTGRRRYIRDSVLTKPAKGHVDVDLQSPKSPSAIGRLIYRKVFCEPPNQATKYAQGNPRLTSLAGE